MLDNPWMSEPLADSLLEMLADSRQVRDDLVLPGVVQALGRSGRTFAEWVTDHRDAFRRPT